MKIIMIETLKWSHKKDKNETNMKHPATPWYSKKDDVHTSLLSSLIIKGEFNISFQYFSFHYHHPYNNTTSFNDDEIELITLIKRGGDVLTEDILKRGFYIYKIWLKPGTLHLFWSIVGHDNSHITRVCWTLHHLLRALWLCRSGISHNLDEETSKMLVHTLVSSKINYSNCLLLGLQKNKRKEKKEEKSAVYAKQTECNFTRTKKRDHVLPTLALSSKQN